MNMPIGKVVILASYNSCLLWKTADEYHEYTALIDCYVIQLSITITKTAGKS